MPPFLLGGVWLFSWPCFSGGSSEVLFIKMELQILNIPRFISLYVLTFALFPRTNHFQARTMVVKNP